MSAGTSDSAFDALVKALPTIIGVRLQIGAHTRLPLNVKTECGQRSCYALSAANGKSR